MGYVVAITGVRLCPDNIGIEWDTFTATSDQFTLFSTADNSLIEFTLVP